MSIKSLNLFGKILISLIITAVMVLICGRNHFILGTALITLRWFLFGIGLLLLFIIVKRKAPKLPVLALIISVAVLLCEYGWNKLNEKHLKPGQTSTEVLLMTYNVFFKNTSPGVVLAQIKTADPDILAIQELSPNWKTLLENSIGHKYPYKRVTALRGTHGIGVYSKFAITDSKLLGATDRPYAQIVTLRINEKAVQLFNVHLASPAVAVERPAEFLSLFNSNYNLRRQQVENINTAADQSEADFNAQIVMGDLNTTRYEPLYRDITDHWVDLHDLAGSGMGFTFPNVQKLTPVLTLDYMFVRGVLGGVDSKVIDGGSSDHLAIVGKVKI